mgnify:CR=1 FL=1
MGSIGPDGTYGYYGRPLAIMVRFPGLFLDTAPPPLALMNQTTLLFVSAGNHMDMCETMAKKGGFTDERD